MAAKKALIELSVGAEGASDERAVQRVLEMAPNQPSDVVFVAALDNVPTEALDRAERRLAEILGPPRHQFENESADPDSRLFQVREVIPADMESPAGRSFTPKRLIDFKELPPRGSISNCVALAPSDRAHHAALHHLIDRADKKLTVFGSREMLALGFLQSSGTEPERTAQEVAHMWGVHVKLGSREFPKAQANRAAPVVHDLSEIDEDHVLVGPDRDPEDADVGTIEGHDLDQIVKDYPHVSDISGISARRPSDLVPGYEFARHPSGGHVLMDPQGELAGAFVGCDIAVDESHQGQGLGKELALEHFMETGEFPTWDHETPAYSDRGAACLEAARRLAEDRELVAAKTARMNREPDAPGSLARRSPAP